MENDLIPHLFRTEFRKITSVLCKFFGVENIEVAEDIAMETFITATETWPYKGIPANPSAWLYSVAKKKGSNYLTRSHIFADKVFNKIKAESEVKEQAEIDLSEKNIVDSQLQMMFALCHPSIPPEAQVGLSLRILCGFGIEEIANAFLTNKETINKRLFRAKEKLRTEGVKIEMPPVEETNSRLANVLTTLYLLFSEGYYSESQDSVLREDLCLEAMELTHLLIENPLIDRPSVNALFSLMCFHASRFPARRNSSREIVLYEDQDERLWNWDLIAKGAFYLNKASIGKSFSRYHLEAGIAYWYTKKDHPPEKWENILQLYNLLLQTEYSPIAALNRTYALAKANGKEEAIKEAEKLNLVNNHYYFSLLGELYKDVDPKKAQDYLSKALSLAKTQADKQVINRRLDEIRI